MSEKYDLIPISSEVLGYMLRNNISLSCCESCTGGWFAKIVTDYPGVSAIFDRGLVTYSNRAKTEELGVDPKTLEKYSAVSIETALEMAEGLHRVCESDLCVSVTGYAGPLNPEYPDEPVGLVYIGLWYDGRCCAYRFRDNGADRDAIRRHAVYDMFRRIKDVLKIKNNINV